MAYVQSLGLHEPSALPYLIEEYVLPNHQHSVPPYTWSISPVYDAAGEEVSEDELLQTKSCVIWARGGIVKRAFDLEVEDEEILHSFITRFPTGKGSSEERSGLHGTDRSQGGQTREIPSRTRRTNEQAASKALVVILKTRAHIYFLSGETHLVSIPFEVVSAFPTPQGCLLQRKASMPAPQNSFVSSQLNNRTKLQHVTLKTASNFKPSLTLSPVPPKLTVADTIHDGYIPSVFSLTDPQADLGVAVKHFPSQTAARASTIDREHLLDPAEEIVYVSCSDEISLLGLPNLEPIILAVTRNVKSSTFTVWKVQFRDRDSQNSLTSRRKRSSDGPGSRRRSSKMFRVNGSATPVGRGLGESRESLGALLDPPFPEVHVSLRHEEHRSSEVEDLATELGHDWADVGVQTRASRRVSSMLARTDLSMGPDRAPINGFASNNTGRKSLTGVGPRGDTVGVGDFRDRQSFGARAAGPIPRFSSFVSNETSFAATPVDRPPEGLGFKGEFEGSDTMVLDGPGSQLPAEVIFTKVHNISSTSAPVTRSSERRFTVFTLASTTPPKNGSIAVANLSVYIMDREKSELSVTRLEAMLPPAPKSKQNNASPSSPIQKRSLNLTALDMQRGTNIIDACKIRDGAHSCMLVLTQNRDGQIALSLEAVGVPSVNIDLPCQLQTHDPFCISPMKQRAWRREGGRSPVLKLSLRSITSLGNTSIGGQLDIVDSQAQRHRLRIQLEPHHPRVKKILQLVEFAAQEKGENRICFAWIEVMKWLRLKGNIKSLEWSAMVITLFSMVLPFIPDKRGKGRPSGKQKKSGPLRSNSGAIIDMSHWDQMLDEECGVGGTSPAWCSSPGWNWICRENNIPNRPVPQPISSKPSRGTKAEGLFEGRRNTFLLQCVSWTREFMHTPIGEQILGTMCLLPTAPTKERETRRVAIASVLIALHLLREEQKLDIRSSQSDDSDIRLAPVLAQMGHWLKWPAWGSREGCYYHAEIPDVEQHLFDDNTVTSFDLPSQPFVPPSIFEFVEACYSSAQVRPFLTLLDIIDDPDPATADILMLRAKTFTPRTFLLVKYFSGVASLRSGPARVDWMCKCELDVEILATMPAGISAAFRDSIASCQGHPPSSWSESLLELVDRDDLKIQPNLLSTKGTINKSHGIISHEATRDYHGIGNAMLDTEPPHSWDASSEADRQWVTRLIFRDDRRFQDASRLVNQLRTPVAECQPEPDWTEADLLDAQRELVQLVTMRTLTVASGRGIMNYSSRIPLLTEKVTVSAFTLHCQVRPSNVTFTADRASFTEDRAVWAFFHIGTAAGLAVSKDARGIDTSWILYNKPPELTNRHAGFLLALGLNGHLRSLAKWVAFKYLTPKHTMTSIGLLLGLSASYLGSMDTLITRLLSVHVTRMLPPGAAELNLSPLTQTTGIMGIGLLYCSTQHRRMSEVMLSEIENNDIEEGIPPEQTLRDESYRLAAGFALGFINLGQGKRLHGLHDMNVMERLLTMAIGTKNVNLVPILDRATSGATVAFALIYMKTNDESIARKIDIPDTLHQFDYVRPDIFLLRTVARHLIMWSSIQPTSEFIQSSLPKAYRHRVSLFTTRCLHSEDMPFFNIVAGLCLVLGLRFAGSGSHRVRDWLIYYLDQFIRLTRLPAPNYDAKLTRNAVRNCQDVTALALAAVMAGTGDIVVFRRLRSLHGRVDPDTPYGSHLAAHMAIGLLFLGGGTYTLGTSDIAVASLLCAFYPLFPTNVMDNQAHLQAFRHLWVLATEPRCVVCRDVETRRPVSVPIVVSMRGGGVEDRHLIAPCLVPDMDTIREIRIEAKGYWDVRISFEGTEGEERKSRFRKTHLNVFLRRRAAYDTPRGSVFVGEMEALSEQGPAPSVGLPSTTAVSSVLALQGRSNPFEWLWELAAFRDLDVSERALVLPHASAASWMGMNAAGPWNRFLRGTVVDTRLELEHGILADEMGQQTMRIDRDKLWQLRLLFAWVDASDREEEERKQSVDEEGEGIDKGENGIKEGGNWLRREVVERLRWRVWKLGAGVEDDGIENE